MPYRDESVLYEEVNGSPTLDWQLVEVPDLEVAVIV